MTMKIVPVPDLDRPTPPTHIHLTIDLNITNIARTLINTIHSNNIEWAEEDASTLEYLVLLIREKINISNEVAH